MSQQVSTAGPPGDWGSEAGDEGGEEMKERKKARAREREREREGEGRGEEAGGSQMLCNSVWCLIFRLVMPANPLLPSSDVCELKVSGGVSGGEKSKSVHVFVRVCVCECMSVVCVCAFICLNLCMCFILPFKLPCSYE